MELSLSSIKILNALYAPLEFGYNSIHLIFSLRIVGKTKKIAELLKLFITTNEVIIWGL